MFDNSGEFVARVSAEFKGSYHVLIGNSEIPATVTGRMMHQARTRLDYPCVGDDVAIAQSQGTARIEEVLPRRSIIVRQSPSGEEQPLAANVDYLFIVNGLDRDFNPRRIERYVALAYASAVTPIILLNKADASNDAEAKTAQIEAIAPMVAVHSISALHGQGLSEIAKYVQPGKTIALVGSSGAGKSTLANALTGNRFQTTGAVRADDARGRHTTTHRQLIALTGGASLIDTPGLRELQLAGASEGIESAFHDIESLANGCRFGDCAHNSEPGCAVRAAINDGELNEHRYKNYLKLQSEQAYYDRRGDRAAEAEERDRWKAIHRDAQAHIRFRRKQR